MTGVNHYIPGMPRGSRTLTRALSAALLSAAALSACVPFGTDADAERHSGASASLSPVAPSAAETTAPPLSPSPSPTVTAYPALGPLPDGVAPARPAAMDGPPTLEGAKAIATYFLLLYPYVYQSGDVRDWNSISDPQCVFCGSVQKRANDQRGQALHLEGGGVTVTEVHGTEVTVGAFFDVNVRLAQAPSKTVSTLGVVTTETTGGDATADVVVTFKNGTWQIRELSTKVRAAS